MKSHSKYYMIGLIVLTILWSIAVTIYFWYNGYVVSFCSNDIIDIGATQTYVALISLVVVPVTSLLAVIIYKRALDEQKSTSRNELFFRMVQRQDDIRNNLYLSADILINQNPYTEKAEFVSNKYFEYMCWCCRYLTKALDKNMTCIDWDGQIEAYIEEKEQISMDKVDWHIDPKWCEQQLSDSFEKHKCYYLSHLYNNKIKKSSDNQGTAFVSVFENLQRFHRSYFTHLTQLFEYITHSVKDPIEKSFYENYLVSTMTRNERKVVFDYFKYIVKDIRFAG